MNGSNHKHHQTLKPGPNYDHSRAVPPPHALLHLRLPLFKQVIVSNEWVAAVAARSGTKPCASKLLSIVPFWGAAGQKNGGQT